MYSIKYIFLNKKERAMLINRVLRSAVPGLRKERKLHILRGGGK